MKIIGCGSYLPEQIFTNYDLEKLLDTSDEWIKTRTGISQRHIAAKEESTSDLALKATHYALAQAQIPANTLDLIIVCTTSADHCFPAVATRLQGQLGLTYIPSFDLQAVCSGFVYGLQVAHSLMQTNQYDTILLVGTEKMSALLLLRLITFLVFILGTTDIVLFSLALRSCKDKDCRSQ